MKLSILRNCPGTTGNSLLARPATPYSNRVSLHAGLAAEGTWVSSMLGYLHLFNLLPKRGTVSIRDRLARYCSSCYWQKRGIAGEVQAS